MIESEKWGIVFSLNLIRRFRMNLLLTFSHVASGAPVVFEAFYKELIDFGLFFFFSFFSRYLTLPT